MEFEYIKRIVKYKNGNEEVIIYWNNGRIERSYFSKKDLDNIEFNNGLLRGLEFEVDRVVNLLRNEGYIINREVVEIIKSEEIEYGVNIEEVGVIVINRLDNDFICFDGGKKLSKELEEIFNKVRKERIKREI